MSLCIYIVIIVCLFGYSFLQPSLLSIFCIVAIFEVFGAHSEILYNSTKINLNLDSYESKEFWFPFKIFFFGFLL